MLRNDLREIIYFIECDKTLVNECLILHLRARLAYVDVPGRCAGVCFCCQSVLLGKCCNH